MNYYNYFTEIEEHFVRRRGKHLYISPLDWSLIATWRDSSVPLHVALRGIDRAMDSFLSKQSRGESRVSSLFYCHASVMEEYARHLEAHLGEASAPPAEDAGPGARKKDDGSEGPDKERVLEFLQARIAEIKTLAAKLPGWEDSPEGTARIVLRLEEIARDLEADHQVDFEAVDRDLAILDEALVRFLSAAIPATQLEVWEQEAKKELKIYRKKLPKETYEKILENFRRTKIHRHFDLGELSIFHM
jgi:hypothetical protein